MIKRIIPFLFVILMLVSCSTVDTFTEDKPYIQYLGQEGEYIITTTKDLINIDKISVSRISAAYNPNTGLLYGTVEGDFSKVLFNSALKISGDFIKRKDADLNCWYYEDKNIELYCPFDNLVLFSNSKVSEVYKMLKDDRTFVDEETSLQLLSYETGLYIKNPSKLNVFNVNIPEYFLDSIKGITLSNDGENNCACLEIESEEEAKNYLAIIKASLIAQYILKGEKADLNSLSKNIYLEENKLILTNNEIFNIDLSSILNEVF